MPNQTIPITFQFGVPPTDAQWTTLAQLGALLVAHMTGNVQANVTFIPQVVNDPSTLTDGQQLIYNIVQHVFKGWDAGTGTFIAVSPFKIGDLKHTVSPNDEIADGWVILDGRFTLISAIPGISMAQQGALATVFHGGVLGGDLPVMKAVYSTNLPVGNAFGDIPWPTILPAAGVIGALPFTDPPTGPEAEALRDDTEILRNTTNDVFELVKDIQAMSQTFLSSLNEQFPTVYVAIFCGYK